MRHSGNYNWAQLKRYAIYGCLIAGPVLHGWYTHSHAINMLYKYTTLYITYHSYHILLLCYTATHLCLFRARAPRVIGTCILDSRGKIPNPEIRKILKLSEYVGDFLLITTQFLFAAKIHSKGVKLTPENSPIFQFSVITREL